MYGSVARAQEHAVSDVDLMVIGDVGPAALTPALRRLERSLGREVNATVYSKEEFLDQSRKKNHFLTAILQRPKHFVKGSEHDLEETAGN